MINNRKDNTNLQKFSELYECARLAYEETMEGFERNLQQYRGSTAIDGGLENASAVRNITYELIESAISAEIPYAKVEAESYSERGEALSGAVERLLYTTRERLPLDEINDSDERCTYIFGGRQHLLSLAFGSLSSAQQPSGQAAFRLPYGV